MILVVGGTGTIGSEVVRLLKAENAPFQALVRDPAKADGLKAQGVETVAGDLRQPETLPEALQGAEKVFVVTPLVPDQVQMRANLIAAAKTAGVKHVVMSTGIGAAPDAPVQIGRWHGENQKQLQESGMAWTFVQPGFFMQNLLMYAEAIREKGEFYMPLGEGKVSWIDARDIAAVAAKALTEPGHEDQAYPVTGPEALSGAELGTILTEIAGHTVNYVPISLDQAKQAMTSMGMPEMLAEAMNELYALAPAGHLAGVLDTVEKVTGRPARSFWQFAQDHARAFKKD
ncbi:SDR family oxidoreductase [Polymorphum gilvum]|uniref:NAD(P)H azoreductase n=1 Tax=Polymorphum gilvum (strain LMG 25793 / CGMCC 1.9160 / SL003B-26A1) TaxID=991905 RepID=F2J4V3_POLGS|nr:SDR family oxidoreductase [Polymorphum gilvum]ADZ69045.1 NAD(P)H azoreductase [Polymorphum gilvum SL003B-26A1]